MTSRWQSSKVPCHGDGGDVAAERRELRLLHGADRPSGNSTTTRVPATPKKACATALPVSPDVATRTVNGVIVGVEMRHQARHTRAPTSLNAKVGP